MHRHPIWNKLNIDGKLNTSRLKIYPQPPKKSFSKNSLQKIENVHLVGMH